MPVCIVQARSQDIFEGVTCVSDVNVCISMQDQGVLGEGKREGTNVGRTAGGVRSLERQLVNSQAPEIIDEQTCLDGSDSQQHRGY